uniref:Ig-like domain-containing protein n=1 Tax=Sparus aurata TaxID=8175 RepID=A0A671XFF7_SPAAU
MSLAQLSKNSVQQTPTALIKHAGEEVLMSCKHSNTDFFMIQWYKQSLLGYMYVSPTLEDGAGVKIEGSAKKDETCTLTIEDLRLNSSAVYFCAARYTQCYISLILSTKTSSSNNITAFSLSHLEQASVTNVGLPSHPNQIIGGFLYSYSYWDTCLEKVNFLRKLETAH